MDPDVTLGKLRVYAKKLQDTLERGVPLGSFLPDPDDVLDFVLYFQALDDSLSKGGMLPNTWNKRNRGIQIGDGNTQINTF